VKAKLSLKFSRELRQRCAANVVRNVLEKANKLDQEAGKKAIGPSTDPSGRAAHHRYRVCAVRTIDPGEGYSRPPPPGRAAKLRELLNDGSEPIAIRRSIPERGAGNERAPGRQAPCRRRVPARQWAVGLAGNIVVGRVVIPVISVSAHL